MWCDLIFSLLFYGSRHIRRHCASALEKLLACIGFTNDQYYPPPMDPWSKVTLGWVTPTVISSSDKPYTIGPQCQSNTIFKITSNFVAGEYLLVENRQKVCLYDSRMDGSFSGGLAIFHIDENQPSFSSQGYPGQSGWPGNGNHYKVALLQSDTLFELEKNINQGNSGDLFHDGATLGPSTSSSGPYPNSDSYAFGKGVTLTGIQISSITTSGNNISFLLKSSITKPSLKPSSALSLQPTGFTPVVFRSTAGPIRSILERCVDGNAANFVSGVQLQVWDCNGTPAQKWWRPSSTDLRLQTSNNLCMDAFGNAGSGGAVVLSTCNANLQSQKWVYDGRNLRPKYNTAFCLNIAGGSSFNGAKLIVSSCNNGSNGAWMDYSMSSLSGAAISGDTYNHFLCPVGSKVINISGRGGSWVDQLVMICDDKKTVLGPVGGTGGGAVTSSNCTSGYTAVNVTSGNVVGQVKAVCSGSSTLTALIGSATSNGSGPTTSLVMQGTQRVIGMQVNSGTYVNALALLYSSVTTSPSMKPSQRPTVKPTRLPSPKPILRYVACLVFIHSRVFFCFVVK